MPVDFSLDNLEDETHDLAAEADAIVDDFDTGAAPDFGDIESRLEKAALYKFLLQEPIFTEENVYSQAVTEEIRGFVRERMQALLGSGPESNLSPERKEALEALTDPEVARALLALASRVLKKPLLLNASPTARKQPASRRQAVRAKPAPRRQKLIPAERQPLTPPAKQPKIKGPRPQKVEAVNANGETYLKDITVQAQPVSGAKPFPTPVGNREIEMSYNIQATRQAAEALKAFQRSLSDQGKNATGE